MGKVVVIQHEPLEGPGRLAAYLQDPQIIRTFAGDPVPLDADALVVLGGGMSAYDPLPHLKAELALIHNCLDRGVPILGICLGSQLLALALGAKVQRAPAKEIGFYRVRLTPGADSDPLFAGLDPDFVAFHWHGDVFELPDAAVALASSTLTPLQAFRFGANAWGIQFHLEIDETTLAAMVSSGSDELAAAGVDQGLLVAQATRELPRLIPFATSVFSRWAALKK